MTDVGKARFFEQKMPVAIYFVAHIGKSLKYPLHMIRHLLFSVLAVLLLASFTFFTSGPGDPDPGKPASALFYTPNGNPNWLKVREGMQVSASDVLRGHTAELGLSALDELRVYRTQTDGLGMVHYRCQQYHRGVKVEHAEVLIHELGAAVQSLNGRWPRGLNADVSASISAEEALSRALAYMPATRYMWEDAAAERMIKKVRKDPKASFFPETELVLIDPAMTQQPEDYRLAYGLIVHTQLPVEQRKQLYIDARTGAVILELELLCDNNDTPGIAETKYTGARQIVTDSLSENEFRLVESGRGGGIETYDLNRSTNVENAVDFLDEDNFWDNVNSQQDEAATDAHWGAEMTFDYYLEKHNYIGIDGDSMPLISYVHYDNSWVNAQWTGGWAQFGDGDGSGTTALTSLDVVGHEFTHGVTGSTANLVYRDESGALNESFSDIFGAAVEFYAAPETGDWDVGEDFHIGVGRFRSMADPKAEGDPDTYLGQHWAAGSGDNGGVHTNSGVQNKWFVLLTEGGEGANDNGDDYNLTGLGLDTAEAIAFRNLQHYLVRRSQFFDARFGSIQAAEDLYGVCSEAAKETARAWQAVGVGGALEFDMSLLEILNPVPIECGFPADGAITLRFRYNGCNTLEPGDKIPFAFQVNESEVQWDTLTLSEQLLGGDTLLYTYAVPAAELAAPAVHELRCWAALEGDGTVFNDALEMTVDNILAQNVDFGLMAIRRPFSGCFLTEEPIALQMAFYGCDSIAAGEELELNYSFNDGPVVSETIVLPQTLYRGDDLSYDFNAPVNIPVQNDNTIKAWVRYGPDFLLGNDSIVGKIVANPPGFSGQALITFEGGATILDSMYLETGPQAAIYLNENGASTGDFGIQMTGGNLPQAVEEEAYTIPSDESIWDINEDFSAKMCFCADLSNLSNAQLRFDLRQTFTTYYITNLGGNRPQGSPLRVLLNGEQAELYLPSNFFNDPWKARTIDLGEYAGGTVEICFETRNGMRSEFDPNNRGDNAFIDNILIGDFSVDTEEPAIPRPELQLFPNPFSGQLTVILPNEMDLPVPLQLFDARGRLVRNQLANSNRIQLDLQALPSGVYWGRAQYASQWLTERVVKW